MRNPQQLAIHHPLIRSVLELLAIVFVWLVVVGSGTACFFAPRGSEAQPTYYDLIGFGCSLAIAAAVATSVAFALGGKMRWAGHVLLAIALATAAATALWCILLWVDPLTLRSHMDAWSFLRLRQGTSLWGEQIAGFQGPLAAGVGVVVGVVSGVLILLARKWPRLATMLALTLLFACAASAVQESLFGLVVIWGRIIRWHIMSGGLIDDQISESGAVFGAIAGALTAVISSHLAGRRVIHHGSE